MERYNDRRDATIDLATPGTACAYCRQASACDVVWTASPDGFIGVEGQVESIITEGSLTTMTMVRDEERFVVVGCPEIDLPVGTLLRIAHLGRRGESGFRWQPDRSLLAVTKK